MINNKKADLSMNMIVIAAIAVIVLLVIISIFIINIKKPTTQFKHVSDSTGGVTECKSLMLSRSCSSSSICEKDGKTGTHISYLDKSCENDKTVGNYCCDFS